MKSVMLTARFQLGFRYGHIRQMSAPATAKLRLKVLRTRPLLNNCRAGVQHRSAPGICLAATYDLANPINVGRILCTKV